MGGSTSRCDFAGYLDEKEPPKKLKCPGQFERLQDDAKRVTAVHSFEGAKFELAKPLTPTFAVNHNFWLGGSYYPSANQHYKFGATLGDAERVCLASVDQYGTVEGQFYGAVAGPFTGKLIFNLPNDPKGFVGVCDLDYGGATCAGQLKIARNIHGVAGTHAACSFVQAITSRLALGGEGTLAAAQPASTLTAAAKWTGDKWSGVASCTKAAGGSTVSLGYARTVSPNRVTLGSELTLNAASLEAQAACGAEFALKQSKVGLCVDSAGKMASTIETSLSPAAKLLFSAEMQLGWEQPAQGPRDQFKFGYGLQIGQ